MSQDCIFRSRAERPAARREAAQVGGPGGWCVPPGKNRARSIGDHATNIAETVYYIVEGRTLSERPKAALTSIAAPPLPA